MRTFTNAILPRKRRLTLTTSRTGTADDCLNKEAAEDTTIENETCSTFSSIAVVAGGGGSTAERGRLAGYARRLPVRVPFLGRSADNAEAPAGDLVPHVGDGAYDPPWRVQALREPSVVSESVALENSSDNNGGGSVGLLKRVSSMPGNLSLFRAHLIDPLRRPEFYAAPRYTRNQPIRLPANDPDTTPMFGYALLALTVVVFVAAFYSLVVSKFMPYTGIAFVDAVKDDRYFCLLMPVTGLSFVFAVFWNWIGMKFFRHN